MPTGTRFAILAAILLTVTFALALFALIAPKRIHLAFALVVALVALGTMGSFEMVRESIRKTLRYRELLICELTLCKPDARRWRLQRR